MAEELAQTTEEAAGEAALASALGALRVTSRTLLNEAYAAPWGVAVPRREVLGELLGTGSEARLVPFHLVRRGAFTLEVAGRPPRLVTAGEVVLVTSGAPHRLSEGKARRVLRLEDLLQGAAPRGTGPTSTSLLCGVFVMHDVRFNPLFEALPPVLQVPLATPAAGYVARGVADLLAAETTRPGGGRPWVVDRLLELVCAEAVLHQAAGGASWVRAVKDRGVGAALGAFHRAPGEGWTVARLARHAGLSPSRFAARFRQLLAESPMSYVATWRLASAARLLRDTDARVEEVGRSVGYDSLPAFSRAFRRQWGVPPSAARGGAGR